MKSINIQELHWCNLDEGRVEIVGVRSLDSEKPVRVRVGYSDFCYIVGEIKRSVEYLEQRAIRTADKFREAIK